jgi:hypothetical protein
MKSTQEATIILITLNAVGITGTSTINAANIIKTPGYLSNAS